MTDIRWTGSIRYTGVVVLAAIFLCVLSPQEIAASNGVVQDSTDTELEPGTNSDSQKSPSLTEVSIQDLFRDYTDDVSRLSAAYDLIGAADEAKLIDLFDQAIKRKYTQDYRAWKSELISLISTQLAAISLDKAVSLYEAQPLDDAKYMLYGITHAWASKEFEGAVEFTRNQDPSLQWVALRGIVDASFSLPEATLMDLGTEFGDLAYVERAIRDHKLKIDLADPDAAWTALINDPTSHLEENFFRIEHVANALIEKYGVVEVDNLLSSINSPALNFKLRKSILSNVARSEPETALDYALETPNDVFGSMLTTVINTWANIDPERALTRVRLLEPSSVRDRLQHIVMRSWIQLDPTKFLDSLDSVPMDLRDTARMNLIGQLSKDSIEDALAVFADMSEVANEEQAALTIVAAWIDTNPDATFQWIVTNSKTEAYRDSLLGSFFEKLADLDADKAIELALSQPISDENEIGLETIVIDELRFSDTDLALRLLSRVRQGATQLAAYESVATGLIFDQKIDEAIELGKALSDKAQISYYNSMTFSIANQVPLKKILKILPNIPVEEAQSEIAEDVLLFSSFRKDEEPLSSEDKEALLGYVAPSELQRLKFLISR